MAVVIDEIVITVEVAEGKSGKGQSSATGHSQGAAADRSHGDTTGADRASLVADCVEQVMQILRDRREP
ncbi:MAG: hypothetical protein RLZZ536_1730 [Planctomycetota bacterium]|jgi:hypothetical protein